MAEDEEPALREALKEPLQICIARFLSVAALSKAIA
jgi:hypothetical protein